MDNTVIILGLFIFISLLVTGSVVYYIIKARKISKSEINYSNLMAEVHKELTKKED